jgi:hypothetical protein
MNSATYLTHLGKDVLRPCEKSQEASRNVLLWIKYYPVTKRRGFLKNAAKNMAKALGLQALRSKVENYLFVFPRHIWLKEEVDGIVERPLQCDTPKGKRISLAASEMVKDVEVKITLHLFPHPELTWAVVEELLNYGQYEGISQWRGASYGRFSWKFIDLA